MEKLPGPRCIATVGYVFHKYMWGSHSDAWDKHKHCVLGCIIDRACGHEFVESFAKIKEWIDKIVTGWHPDPEDIPPTLEGGDCPRWKMETYMTDVPCRRDFTPCEGWRTVKFMCRDRKKPLSCAECYEDLGWTYRRPLWGFREEVVREKDECNCTVLIFPRATI